jgi:hypothetical protein
VQFERQLQRISPGNPGDLKTIITEKIVIDLAEVAGV